MSYVKVYKYKKQISLDNGVTWQDVTPEEYVPSGDPIGYYDTYEECMTLYRTVESTTCAGTYGVDKCEYTEYQVSYDNGETWSTYSAVTGSVIEYNSVECGYEPPKYRLYLNDSSIISASCDSTSAITQDEISAYTSTTVSVEIGECVTSIDDFAFNEYTSLTSCTLGDSVTSIGGYAFADCSSLTSIDMPNGVTSVDSFAFSNCTSLTSIDIPDSVTNIGVAAFLYCTSLTSVTIGSGVTSIGINAFQDCSSLTSVTINATTPPTLGSGAFDYTNNCPIYVPCESVNAYKSATGWSDYASRIQGIPPCGQPTFNGKYKLTLSDSSTASAECDSTSAITSGEVSSQYSGSVISAEIGECVTTIGNGGFYNCYSLTSINIPDSVTNIGTNAFRGCASLTSCTIGTGVTTINHSDFRDCSGLTNVTIPNNVTSISGNAFSYCTSLTSVAIPNSVTAIGNLAFNRCSGLTSCTIGTGIAFIGMSAFYQCSSLTGITINATTPPTLGSNVFDGTNYPLYVPSGSVDTYKSASGWNRYSSRIQAIP